MSARLPGQGGTVRFEGIHAGAPPTPRPRGAALRAIGVRAAQVAATILCMLALVEVGLRAARVDDPHPPDVDPKLVTLFEAASNSRLGWRLAPGARVDLPSNVSISINEAGYRGPFHSRESSTAVRRVAVLGDEQAFGQDLPYESTFAGMLEQELRARAGGPWQVLSFAVPGYDLVRESELWRAKVREYRPNVVVLCYAADDLVPTRTLAPRGWSDRLALVRGLRQARARRELPDWNATGTALASSVERAFSAGSPLWRANREALLGLAGEICRQQSRLVIVVMPLLVGVGTREELEHTPFARYYAALGTLADDGIPVVDPFAPLVALGGRPAALSADSGGRRQSALANQRIVAAVIESGALEPQQDLVPCPNRASD